MFEKRVVDEYFVAESRAWSGVKWTRQPHCRRARPYSRWYCRTVQYNFF